MPRLHKIDVLTGRPWVCELIDNQVVGEILLSKIIHRWDGDCSVEQPYRWMEGVVDTKIVGVGIPIFLQ